MTYRAIGLMSGSSLDGLDIAFVEFVHNAGSWSYEIAAADCYGYNEEWKAKLQYATTLSAQDYQLLHVAYGHYIGEAVNRFIAEHNLHYKVGLVSSHGHTTFHIPEQRMTAQLGDGASIAAETGLPVVSDLRAMDLAFGGQGAPIVPIGEKLLLPGYDYYLNLGGIANISFNSPDNYVAFDICPANRVLNLLAAKEGKEYDASGRMAAAGELDDLLLLQLSELDYYEHPYPKSLANSFGNEIVFPLIESHQLSTADALRTYVEHVAVEISKVIPHKLPSVKENLLVTGGGAFNSFLIERLSSLLAAKDIEVLMPDEKLVQYKEAVIMAFIGVLRWRQEYNVLSSVTGASRDSIGGAVWIGQEA